MVTGTSLTFIIVVPFTILIWLAARWDTIAQISDASRFWEKLFGVGIYAADIAFNVYINDIWGYRYFVLGIPRGPNEVGFGLIDMLVAFVSVCIAFYGLRGFKHFKLPTAYLVVLVIGYELEYRITEVAFLQNSLATLMSFLLNALGIPTSASGNLVTVEKLGQPLLIDASCTGIKGILAYGSLAVLMILDVKATKKRKAILTSVGFIGTFLVNILRLLTIFIVAYFFGIEAGLAVHVYLGYSLFIVWVLLFWTIAFKYLLHQERPLSQA
ncbi:MAG: exosortase/archaeosortase family protein [Candidatus Bathyarchaeota archaeon]|nr:MAG: exosortase/archaeosortase family protein [Candidatus Bathyarchaeota archaeon]